jgi:chromosome segregation ATPase
MEFLVATPATPLTVKARLPLLQARRQLPFSFIAGTPKRKKTSSSTKKGDKSAGGSVAGDSTTSGEEKTAASKSGRKSIRDTLAVEVAALKEQLSKVQMDLLNRQLETVQIVASVRSDLMQLHNQLQLYQEAHVNLEGVVGHTATRLTNTEASISDIHTRLSDADRKQEEVKQALEALKAMPMLAAGGPAR